MTQSETAKQVEQFVSVLFEPTDILEIRMIPQPRGGQVLQQWTNMRDIAAKIPELTMANTEGRYDIYVGVNPRMRDGGASEKDVACARCLFADWDDCTRDEFSERIKKSHLPEPSLAIFSGRGMHGYWRLTAPMIDFDRWKLAQQKLIDFAKSDSKIKDPPRVMRLPGFFNLPDPRKDETDAIEAVIHSIRADAFYRIEQIVGELTFTKSESPEPKAAPKAHANRIDRLANLSRSTMQFILAGAPDGERQTRAFHAACDMAGNSFPFAEAEAEILAGAQRCGLPEAEARQAVRSAYGKPRNPARPEGTAGPDSDDDFIGSAAQHEARRKAKEDHPPKNGNGKHAEESQPQQAEEKQPKAQSSDGQRPLLANVVDATYFEEGEELSVRYYIPIQEIHQHLCEATGGWPRQAGEILFALKEVEGKSSVRWLIKTDDLFAWIDQTCLPRWETGMVIHPVTKIKLNPATKAEFHSHLKANAAPCYRGVEVLPHYPPVDDLYYVPCKLKSPPARKVSPLQELINRMNPASELDRLLMCAALLTPGWGGPAGARPAFVFCSEYGRGSGKTATATALADVWGGCISVGMREDWEQVKKRLFSDDGMRQRIALIDNMKGKLHGSDIESTLTAKKIDGWKPYYGGATRPNLLTWYFTSNAPSLSQDVAVRSVIIKVGKPQKGKGFQTWANQFIHANQMTILGEVFEILSGQALCSIDRENRDRWDAWQDAILTRWDNGNELAAEIIARRPEVDADIEDANEIAQAVLLLVRGKFHDHEKRVIKISRQHLQAHLVNLGFIDKAMHPRGVTTLIKDKINLGALNFLSLKKTTEDRYWVYTGPEADPDDDEVSII
jgi:hypothetical protein